MSTILIRIRRLREFCGYTQDEVGDKLGMTQGTYSRLEKGRTRLDMDRLAQIASLYGFTQADLMAKPSTELLKILLDNPQFNDKGGGIGNIHDGLATYLRHCVPEAG